MINIGLIGFGYWAQNYYRLLQEISYANLVWIADTNPRVTKNFTQKKNNIKITSDYFDILKDSSINAVIVATPASTHGKICLDVMNAGKHILVEKPLCADYKEALKIQDNFKKYNKVLMVGHTFLFNPAVKFLKEYIKTKKLGEMFYLYSTRTNLGPVRNDVNVLFDLASHDISTFLYLIGREPQKVYAQGSGIKRKNFPDTAFITLKFPDNLMAHCHVSWLDPVKIRKLTIVGGKQMAVFDDMDSSEKIKIYDKGASFYPKGKSYGEWIVSLRLGDVWVPHISFEEPLKIQLKHFIDCLRFGKKPRISLDHAISVVKILEAANMSFRKGRGINL